MESFWLYISLASALFLGGLYFWCTYKNIHEPTDGRCKDSSIEESRRISMQIIQERQRNIDNEN
jgi:hypothetical protein